jgi:hypothetical protein
MSTYRLIEQLRESQRELVAQRNAHLQATRALKASTQRCIDESFVLLAEMAQPQGALIAGDKRSEAKST